MVGACYGIGFVLGPAIGGLLAPSLDGSWPASAVFGATLSSYIEPFGYGIPMLLAAVLAAINFIFASWALAEPSAMPIGNPAPVDSKCCATPRCADSASST